MALAYAELFKLQADPKFRERVQFALWRAATVVRRELATVPNHDARDAWAKEQLRGHSQNLVPIMTMVCSHNKVVQDGAGVLDGELQNVVDGLVNDFTGV